MPRTDNEDRYRSSTGHHNRERHGSRSKRSRNDDYSDDGDSYEDRRSKHHKKSRKKHSRSDGDSDRKHRRKEKRRYENEDSDGSQGGGRRRSRKDKKSKKQYRRDGDKARKGSKPDKKFLIHMGDPLGKPPSPLLDAQKDYFAFHQHLFVYLHREEGLAFNDLSSAETHDAFERFVEMYNLGLLESDFYKDPLPAAALEEAKTTKHQWSFQTSNAEEDNLHAVQAGVRKQTQTTTKHAMGSGSFAYGAPRSSKNDNNSRGNTTSQDRQSRDRAAECNADRRLREHIRVAEEEFGGGRKEGRERQIEKRKEEAERIHGASRDRGVGVEIGDDALYGDNGSDFKKALEREKLKSAARKEKQQARAAELQAKEKGKQEEMLKVLGLSNLKPGQKIVIAPRND